MKSIRYDPPVDVSGYAIVAVCAVKAFRHKGKGAGAFIGERRPIAIICRGIDGESIFGMDGHRLEKAALQRLISQTGDSAGASAYSGLW